MALFASILPVSAQAVMQHYQLNIPRQSLDTALKDFAHQTGLQVARFSDAPRGSALVVGPLSGDMSVGQALTALLKSTGLTYTVVNDRTIAVVTPRAGSAAGPQMTTRDTSQLSINSSDAGNEEAAKKSFWDRFRLAQVDQGTSSGSTPVEKKEKQGGQRSEKQPVHLEEVVVTAQKREQRLQDVPASIGVITAADIEQRGLVGADDYLRGMPGVNQTESSLGTSIIIRGLETTTTFQNFGQGTTVASYFGETPTTASASITGGASLDARLVDVERVEVLRGPQGTSFGDASLGGAVRIIPVEPKSDAFEASAAASYSGTAGFGGYNGAGQGILNVPVVEGKLAVRASGYQYSDSGFYRNVSGSDSILQSAAKTFGAESFSVNQDNVGASTVSGGRVAALFHATDNLKFTATYLTQKTRSDGWMGANRDGYNQALFQVGPEDAVLGLDSAGNKTSLNLANAVIDYELGWANLIGTYSYLDGGSAFAFPWTLFSTFPIVTAETGDHHERDGEVRVVTKLDGAWNFIAGVFAQRMSDILDYPIYWYGDPSTSLFPLLPGTSQVQTGRESKDLTQKAAYGEVSWRFLPTLTLTGGARHYKYDRDFDNRSEGGLGNSHTSGSASGDGTTYRANLSYKPGQDVLLYASFAQGFRLGGPVAGLPPVCDPNHTTDFVDSDSVNSYELGSKLSFLDRRLFITADVFRAYWSNIPAQIVKPCEGADIGYTTNIGKATSDGVEAQVDARVSNSLSLYAGASWIHARLTTDVPAEGLHAGDPLPAPKANGNLGLQYAFSVGGYKSYWRVDSIYVHTFNSQLPPAATNEVGGYVKLDTSLRVLDRAFALDVFVRNLTNSAKATFFDAYTYQRLRPRTVGLQLSYDFRGTAQ